MWYTFGKKIMKIIMLEKQGIGTGTLIVVYSTSYAYHDIHTLYVRTPIAHRVM